MRMLVEFDVRSDVATFEEQLRLWSETKAGDSIEGYRTGGGQGGQGGLRPQLFDFAVEMERKLRKNDHKASWKTYPIEALVRLLGIEFEELQVALDFGIGDAGSECVDLANFAMMTRDRLLHPPKQEELPLEEFVVPKPKPKGPVSGTETVDV